MPTYVYETIPQDPKEEPRRFEMFQSMRDAELTSDPSSGLPVRRVITGGQGFQVKGLQRSEGTVDESSLKKTTSPRLSCGHAGFSFDCGCD